MSVTAGTAWPQAHTSVERLSVHCQGGEMDATTLRLRVERLLEMADLQPAGLPSGAVLIVRRLEGLSPLPVAALAHSSLPAWRAGVRGQVQALYAAAARPSNGSISPGAASILFNDAGELLTCLTRDLLAGQARQRWYWQSFLRGLPHAAGAALAGLWSKQAAVLPTVLASLPIAEASGAIELLSAGEVFFVTRALHASFDLPSQALDALRSVMPEARRATQFERATSAGAAEPISATDAGEPALSSERREEWPRPAVVLPPWRLANDATTAGLTPQGHYLLGLGLTLYHAPAFARSTAFAQRSVAWLQAIRSSEPPVTTARARRIGEIAESIDEGRPYHATAGGDGVVRAPTEVTAAESGSDGARDAAGMLAAAPTGAGGREFEPQPGVADGDAAGYAEAVVTAESEVDAREGAANGVRAGRSYLDTAGESRPLPADGRPTALGGVLYLLHLLTWLDLPGGWDEEGAFAEGMSGWAIVEAIARGLLGAQLSRYVDDPMWQALAKLDGRVAAEALGWGLPEQTAFRLPARWLRVLGRQEWRALAGEGRLRLVEEGGAYLVVDVPLAGREAGEVIRSEVEAYRARGIEVELRLSQPEESDGPFSQLAPTVMMAMSESAAWWLERVLGFARYFLALRLGDPAFDGEQLAALLFERAGQLSAGRTHIDLYMEMDQISLPIRRAGLDRDPGWMPDLGRIVLFHFD